MNSKEGRLLLIIGVGATLMSALFISQMEERPMAWATHRQAGVEVVDTSPSDCGEGFSAAIEFAYLNNYIFDANTNIGNFCPHP